MLLMMPKKTARVESTEMTYTIVDDLNKPVNENHALPSRTKSRRISNSQIARPRGVYRNVGKRLIDIAILVITAPILLPVLAIVWLITVLDGGHGFYAQTRVGRNGKEFQCWKIRTMVPNAEAKLKKLIREDPEIAREWALNQKLENDPRITRWGHVLRKTSLDELPQLFNVLKGEMSLIGPRPFTPDQRDLYDSAADSFGYYSLRPGISGLWQVDCRNASEFTERTIYDEKYEKSLSFAGDLRIFFKTIAVVVGRTGR
jgi:lipopolysaccharide/colanic/teichoic acid biosynthesis glycosyltransferase